ncbi:hypothetical protein IMCC3317_41890 [Kordia antarctica]|uniref:Uncharacterized protein n=1 Tax=Kordia antarctica TaxID=1218801 RepID=A0A7L4ZQN2_9FLAO|nr:hypothetical protein [Kordia antarctica]QHI38789.1 hypothetical protein IMCC3317_41890 [Kordia antarctica]
MKTNRFSKLNFAKQTISRLDSTVVLGGATQSNQQRTGCQTNCTAWNPKGQ